MDLSLKDIIIIIDQLFYVLLKLPLIGLVYVCLYFSLLSIVLNFKGIICLECWFWNEWENIYDLINCFVCLFPRNLLYLSKDKIP